MCSSGRCMISSARAASLSLAFSSIGFGLLGRRQAGVDRLEQFQPANAPVDVSHQMLADLVGVGELRFGLQSCRSPKLVDLLASSCAPGVCAGCQAGSFTPPSAKEWAA